MTVNNYKKYKVGIYVRLSKEDSREEESLSIENQKIILTKYVHDNAWDLFEIYCDDGFSGTNQNRPALQQMLADIENGYINTVLIKDLSRLGRNYLDVGNLAEVFMPKYGCELISLSEKIDEMLVFRNWFNEQHSRETSKKVRAIKNSYAQHGKFIGSYAPYGYCKSDNKHILIPDELAAAIVREIFKLRADGMGYSAIANQLNNNNIDPPRDYFYRAAKSDNPFRISHSWSLNTVRSILANEVYIGNTVSLKQGKASFKNHKVVRKPKEEWVRVERTHEPLIEMDLWNQVQDIALKRYRPRTKTDGSVSDFCGMLYCAECGFKMRSATQRKIRKNGNQYVYKSFICGTYSRSGKSACSAHAIGENMLYQIVLEEINKYAEMTLNYEGFVKEAIFKKLYGEFTANYSSVSVELQECQNRLNIIDETIFKLYEDRVDGVVSENICRNLLIKYEQEYSECKNVKHTLENRLRESQANENNVSMWINRIKIYNGIETIDKTMLLSLIDRILVSDALDSLDPSARNIQIFYKYVGELSWLDTATKNDNSVAYTEATERRGDKIANA